ncbi:hypothetical protein SAMN05444156_3228 [Verrucomicrobium sp. GAS474]|uniref:major capsid protein n=1 Tax=Verrucomicrobium sp. GAS474 TaxID=1882831 RepID=UPI00087A5DD4|nr:hypothetical protein [Verrucomicrobium sp. GAS474]SDU31216.1 hypothetical protein SAMN05444156_3228 [Verrucomicrobium sp. GAS474]
MPDLNLLDIVRLNNGDAVTGLVESAVTSKVELDLFPAVSRAGTSFQVSRRTALPPVNFAKPGGGVPTSKSTIVLDDHEMFYMEAQLEVPNGIIAAQKRSVGDVLAIESEGTLKSAFYRLTQQMYYGSKAVGTGKGDAGVVSDALGYPGAIQIINGDTDYWIKGGGASGSSTSLFLFCLHEQGAHLSVGQDGNMTLTPWIQQQIALANGNKTMAQVASFMGWFGMSVVNQFSVYRISGLDGTTGNTLTDDLIAQLVQKIPTEYRVNMHAFTSRAGARQLQVSRSSIKNQPADSTGKVGWSPAPTESNDVPLHVTEAIVATESNA